MGELALLRAWSRRAAESKFDLSRPSQNSEQTRLAYRLLEASIDEAVQTIEDNSAQFAAGSPGLRARTIESAHAAALEAIALLDALVCPDDPNAAAVGETARGRRQREAVGRQVIEYLAAARNLISVLTAPPSDPLPDCSKAESCPHAPCTTRTVIERVKSLTVQQKRVLGLLAQGLPNKLIAYELGLCETTVKAHVSEILRKLCVYNRTRAIVLLSDIDLESICSSCAEAKPGRRREAAA
jgi:DNA-binding CsgD family transcriptional regulator